MPRHLRSTIHAGPSLSFILFALLLSTLWLAGGASASDEHGQATVRSVAWGALVIAALFAPTPSLRSVRPVMALLVAIIVLTATQLIPLPPAVWSTLPGREALLEAAAASGQPQPWRPLSIAPDLTVNALSSLVVPVAALLLVAGLREKERAWLPGLLLVLISASTLVGLLQVAGSGIDNPFVNATPGEVSGIFANRNHFALFLAFGCLLVPVWAQPHLRRPGWRVPAAMALILLFSLMILATGSRAGMLVGALAVGIAVLLVQKDVRKVLRRYPRWLLPALIIAMLGAAVLFIWLSIASDRAESINRALLFDPAQDMRKRALPTVLDMVRLYFPAGTGAGTFDPLFRMHEPLELLKPTYFNHAHNDYLEIVLGSGLPGALVLVSALLWWCLASFRAWRVGGEANKILARVGSAMVLLTLIASAVDYPTRTPMIMAVIVIASVWLSAPKSSKPGAALPKNAPDL